MIHDAYLLRRMPFLNLSPMTCPLSLSYLLVVPQEYERTRESIPGGLQCAIMMEADGFY